MDIDPRALLTFREVALTGSFSAAARAMGWTQPALSQQVKRLEQQLNVTLLERSPRGIELTPAGDELLGHATAIHRRLELASSAVQSLGETGTRRVTVAAFPSACTSIVAPIMSYLMASEASPRVEVSLVQREPAEVTAPLLTGAVDLALVFRYEFEDPAWEGADLALETLGHEPMMIIFPRTDPLIPAIQHDVCQLSDFSTASWVSGCEYCRRNLLDAAHRAGFRPDIRHSTDDYMVVQELVARGQCVAMVPYLSLLSSHHPGVTARPLLQPATRELQLVLRKEERSPALERVAANVRRGVRHALAH